MYIHILNCIIFLFFKLINHKNNKIIYFLMQQKYEYTCTKAYVFLLIIKEKKSLWCEVISNYVFKISKYLRIMTVKS